MGVLRLRLWACYAYGYGRATPTVMGVLCLQLWAYYVYGYGRATPTAMGAGLEMIWLQLRMSVHSTATEPGIYVRRECSAKLRVSPALASDFFANTSYSVRRRSFRKAHSV